MVSRRHDGPHDPPLLAAWLTASLPALAGALLLAGAATAPTMVTGMALVQRRTPEGRLNEGMTLAVTGLLGGIACGSATGGWLVEHLSATAGYGVPIAAAGSALAISSRSRRRPTRRTAVNPRPQFRRTPLTHPGPHIPSPSKRFDVTHRNDSTNAA